MATIDPIPVSDKFIQKFIVWIFPAMLTILGTLIYQEISGLRADVRNLLLQQAAMSTDLNNLKKDVERLKDKVFPVACLYSVDQSKSPSRRMPLQAANDVVFLLPDNSYRKPKLAATFLNQ